MFKFISKLFAAPKSSSSAGCCVLSCDALEMREAPASLALNPGVLRGFNPQPDPPGVTTLNPALVRSFDPQPEPPGGITGIIPINSGAVRG